MSRRDRFYCKVVALLLLISFGGFGAHRFYLGLRRSGLAMCGVTAMFLAILSFVAFVLPESAGSGLALLFGVLGLLYHVPFFLLNLLLGIPFGMWSASRGATAELLLLQLAWCLLAVLLAWIVFDAFAIVRGTAPGRPAPVSGSDRRSAPQSKPKETEPRLTSFGTPFEPLRWLFSRPGAAARISTRFTLETLNRKWTALALLFFLGGFGLHRFYLRRRWSGTMLLSVTLVYLYTVLDYSFGPQPPCDDPEGCPPVRSYAEMIAFGALSHVLTFSVGVLYTAALMAFSSLKIGIAFTPLAQASLIILNLWLWVDLVLILFGWLRPAELPIEARHSN